MFSQARIASLNQHNNDAGAGCGLQSVQNAWGADGSAAGVVSAGSVVVAV